MPGLQKQAEQTNSDEQPRKKFVFPERETASDVEYANKILRQAFPNMFKKEKG